MYYEIHQETQECAKNKEPCTFLSFLTDFVIHFLLDFLYARVRKCLFCCSDSAAVVEPMKSTSVVGVDEAVVRFMEENDFTTLWQKMEVLRNMKCHIHTRYTDRQCIIVLYLVSTEIVSLKADYTEDLVESILTTDVILEKLFELKYMQVITAIETEYELG